MAYPSELFASHRTGDCLENGLRPKWCASNPISKRLALSPGYRPAALCDIFFLPIHEGS